MKGCFAPDECWKAVCDKRNEPLYTEFQLLSMQDVLMRKIRDVISQINVLSLAPDPLVYCSYDPDTKKEHIDFIAGHFRSKGFYVDKIRSDSKTMHIDLEKYPDGSLRSRAGQ
jgi:hypothetical protein